jgi:hypothetical protein
LGIPASEFVGVQLQEANLSDTLKYMASNLTAKAQEVVWDQFSYCHPAEVMAAISDRCLQAISGETIPQNQTMPNSASRRMKMKMPRMK